MARVQDTPLNPVVAARVALEIDIPGSVSLANWLGTFQVTLIPVESTDPAEVATRVDTNDLVAGLRAIATEIQAKAAQQKRIVYRRNPDGTTTEEWDLVEHPTEEMTAREAHEIIDQAITDAGWTTFAGDGDEPRKLRFNQAIRLVAERPEDSELLRATALLAKVYAR